MTSPPGASKRPSQSPHRKNDSGETRPPMSLRQLSRLQAAAWTLLLVVCTGALVRATLFDDEVPFVTEGDTGAWIAVPVEPTADLIAQMPDDPPPVTFVRRFDAVAGGADASLRGRALRQVEIELNGEAVDVPGDGVRWKRGFESDVAAHLRDGRNELRATVRNAHGPALLQLSLEMGDTRIETDARWQAVVRGRNPVAAVIARDTDIHPESRLLAPASHVATDQAPILLVLFLTFAAGGWALATRLRAHPWPRAPQATLGAVTVFWLLVYFVKGTRMPVALGFDAHAHLAYIDYLILHASPPTAAYGFSTYHPPIFHTLTALVVGLTGVGSETAAGPALYRIVPMLAGLATVWLTGSVARRLWPGESLRPTLAIAAAGLLPMNVYMATYVSNETLHATWVSLALLIATRAMLGAGFDVRRVLALGGVLGLGLLTKFTSLALAPLIAAFAAARLWVIDGRSAVRAAGLAVALLAVAFGIAGWFYVRNWILFGDPVVWNLDVPGAATWWMLPGFHTTEAYSSFGESLTHPFFSGFASFWDGVYSTLWGDGLVAGMIRVATRHSYWRYDYMTLVHPLALPATALFAWGFVLLVVESFRDPSPARRLVFSMATAVLFVLSFSLLFITLRLPFYAQAKAPYILAATLPLALCAAEGLSWLPRRLTSTPSRPWLAVYLGWLGTLAAVIVVAFLG